MLENCKRLICSPSLNKVYCIVLYCNDFSTELTSTQQIARDSASLRG